MRIDGRACALLAGGLVLAGGLYPEFASAQSADAGDAAVELAPVEVTGRAETATGPVTGFVAQRTATGSKTDTPILEVPQSVSTVTRDQMEIRGVDNLGQALNYSAGVVGQPFGTDSRFDSPIIRGFEASNSQYLNGLKIVRNLGAPSLEPYGMERIEVLRGPASVLYGQGNPGGLINMVSKRPTFDSFGEVNAEAGSFDRYTGSFDIGGPLKEGGEFAYRLTGLVRNGGTQVDDVDDDRYFLAPAFTWAPSNDTSLTILTSIQHDEALSPPGLPNEYTLLDERLPRSRYLGDSDFDDADRTLASVGYEFAHRFNDQWQFRQNGRYFWQNWDYQSLYYSGLDVADPNVANRGASYQDEDLGTFTLDNQVETSFATGPVGHTVLVGADVRHHDVDSTTEFGFAPPIDVFDPQYGVSVPRNIWYNSSEDGSLDQFGVYVQDQARWEKWLLTLGLRHDWAKTDSTTTSNFGNTEQDQNDHAFTTRLGLTYLFDNGIAPYASYSTSFEPVVGNMPAVLGGGAFDPSEGEQYELGIKYQPVGWNALFTATVYDLNQTNVSSSEVIDGVNYTVQEGEIEVKGVELSALASLAEGLNLIANYTYTDAEITAGDNSGNRPANVPEHAANAWLDYTVQTGMLKGLGFGAGVRFVGERYDLNTNNNELDGNTLVDAAIRYERDHYRAQLNINNLTDEKYVASCGSFGCYYGDGFTIAARLSYLW